MAIRLINKVCYQIQVVNMSMVLLLHHIIIKTEKSAYILCTCDSRRSLKVLAYMGELQEKKKTLLKKGTFSISFELCQAHFEDDEAKWKKVEAYSCGVHSLQQGHLSG